MLLEPVPPYVVAARASPWVQNGRAAGSAQWEQGEEEEDAERPRASFHTSPASRYPCVPAQPSERHCWVGPLQMLGCRCFSHGINATPSVRRVEKGSVKDESNLLWEGMR